MALLRSAIKMKIKRDKWKKKRNIWILSTKLLCAHCGHCSICIDSLRKLVCIRRFCCCRRRRRCDCEESFRYFLLWQDPIFIRFSTCFDLWIDRLLCVSSCCQLLVSVATTILSRSVFSVTFLPAQSEWRKKKPRTFRRQLAGDWGLNEIEKNNHDDIAIGLLFFNSHTLSPSRAIFRKIKNPSML